LILENSSWTQAETKYFWNLNAKILYPPVHTEKFRKVDNTNRNGLVLTISRFSSDRGLDNVLNVAKELKKIKFVIVGYFQDFKYCIELKMKLAVISPFSIVLFLSLSSRITLSKLSYKDLTSSSCDINALKPSTA